MNKQMLDKAFCSVRKALLLSLGKIMSCPQDVEDVVQETYLRAVANNTSNSINDPEAYFFRTSRNIALNEKAKLYRRLEVALSTVEVELLDSLVMERSLEHDVEQKRKFAEFCLAISDLPIQCRKVFVLRKVYGFSQSEISKKLGISISTVETHISNGMKKTRKAMSSCKYSGVLQTKGREDGK